MTDNRTNRPVPTGATHEVEVDEMFYSTTDAHGRIEQVNRVFVELSRFRAEDLLGSPHNIVRHPDMPAGVFLLMWNTIGQGRPFCGYVTNLGADGSSYDVFATMTPLGEGHLSVRTRPCRTDLLASIQGVYAEMRAAETAARAAGASGHEAAEAGLARMGELLREQGVASYDDFIRDLLPAEVAARLQAGAQPPRRPGAIGPFADMLDAARQLRLEIAGWLGRLDDLTSFAVSLVHAIRQLSDTLAECRTLAGELQAPADRDALGAFGDEIERLESSRRLLLGDLVRLRSEVASSTFRIALASLHADLLSQAAADSIDDADQPTDVRDAVARLVRAVRKGIQETTGQLASTAQLAQDVAGRIDDLGAMPPVVLPEKGDVTPVVERAARLARRGDSDVLLLRDLADRCRAMAAPLPVGAAEGALASLDRVAGSL